MERDESAQLDLPDPFACDVQQSTEIFHGHPASFGDIERAGFIELPDFEIREIELDGTRLRRDIEIQVVAARHVGAWAWLTSAFLAQPRSWRPFFWVLPSTGLELTASQAERTDAACSDWALPT